MNKFLAGMILGLTSALATANPLAELMENTYGGFAFGRSQYGAYCEGNPADCQNADNLGWKFFSGYRMSPLVSGEIGYLNFERATYAARLPAPAVATTTQALRAEGFVFNLAFRHELSTNWHAVGRVGLAQMKSIGTNYDVSGNASPAGSTKMYTSPYLGVALDWDVSDFTARLLPYPFSRFTVEIAFDTTRVELGGYKHSARMLTFGGGLEF